VTGLPAPLARLPHAARIELAEAVALLERPSAAVRIASMVGLPAQRLVGVLPAPFRAGLAGGVGRALSVAAAAASRSAPGRAPFGLSPAWLQRGMVAASGVVGGIGGLKGALLELSLTTTLLLREILSVAASQGEPADAARTAEALKVFALGSRSAEDDTAGIGYFALRMTLAEAGPGLLAQAVAGVLPGLVRAVAQRFTGPVATKLAAQAAPLIGAAGGVAVNLVFLSHYGGAARGHFVLRRLERDHGAAAVQAVYAEVSGLLPAS